MSFGRFELVLVGGTGELAMRTLTPALHPRFVAGPIESATRTLGPDCRQLSREEYTGRGGAEVPQNLSREQFSQHQVAR